MQFIEPLLLWGTLAVIVPVVIHFWHQKQGKLLPWAATQWLIEKQQQQSRGLRLDNIFLLLVRCLLLVLLAILLAQPILNWFNKPPTIQKVHLVQPSTSVANNFRFELAEALKKGDRVIWADNQMEPVTDQFTPGQNSATFNALSLQTAINTLDTKNTDLHLYLINNQALANVPAITVPARFQLHTLLDSTQQPRPYLAVKNNKKLFVNQAGKLTSSVALDPALKFQSAPVQMGPIPTSLAYKNTQERQTVKAALAALTDVYDLDLTSGEKSSPDQQYSWVLTDQLPTKTSAKTLYVVSGVKQPLASSNVIFTNETLTPQTSERVESGQLPEWLGEQLIRHYGLKTIYQPLSQQGLKTLFVTSTKPTTQQQAGLNNALLLAFVVLLVLERWLALTKNA
ncbi:BatA domain-containing protein [Spirosoma endophyticum]|uniref:N-terminal double-transmembrane domain-containing protein n=1 Tax=Spirosoma endophyticum TaxID=662367 RepID=A0A1I2FKT1_9BACT|nr:BatA domain-containing protein [Spirosoma endophyticum]SFF05459.1 N-terminal double-transmembrane domain-containing protein [Spirosoma endophyticum]